MLPSVKITVKTTDGKKLEYDFGFPSDTAALNGAAQVIAFICQFLPRIGAILPASLRDSLDYEQAKREHFGNNNRGV